MLANGGAGTIDPPTPWEPNAIQERRDMNRSDVRGGSSVPATPWFVCAVLGFCVLALSAVVTARLPASGAGYAEGYGTPVIAFEMARSTQDLVRVFGAEDDPSRPDRIARMDSGTCWDYPFLVAYGAFLGCFFLAVARERGDRRWLAWAAVGPLAALADAMENLILLGLTDDLATARHLAWLPYPVWTKFLLLMLAGIGAGIFLLGVRGAAWRALGVLAIGGSLAVAVAFASPGEFGRLLGPGIGLAWLIQLAFAMARVARRPRAPVAEDS